jgi:hypothetical protein
VGEETGSGLERSEAIERLERFELFAERFGAALNINPLRRLNHA